jgi:polyferredoxin
MKLIDRKRLILIAVSIILGLVFGAFLIYDQLGYFDWIGFAALGITLSITITILLAVIKIGNSDD